ncbi:MAG: FAD-binding oxidoreductase [Negativicutes bacterium]|nr:FAD-binding oxidoreductase [Negativicutes bacterium]
MRKYNPVTDVTVNALKAVLGEKNVTTDPDKMHPYSHDEVADTRYQRLPEVVVLPENTAQVAAVLKIANEQMIPVVPRGGGTGLACGAVPMYGGIVVSLEKMNKILEINAESLYMIVQAGVRTDEVQKQAAKAGLFYAGDPCSSDSCFIGGNVATNAGGNRAIKYGVTRNQIYSIEVVTPKGDITTLGGRLKKNSTGYCLEQLFIGSEGTLGIITTITLKLTPLPKAVMDFLVVFPTPELAIDMVGHMNRAGIQATCIEFMENAAVKSVEKYLKEKLPQGESGNYLIIQVEANNEEQLDEIAAQVDELCSEKGATAVLVPDAEKIWKVRKSIAEAVRHEDMIYSSEDIVVPIDRLSATLEEMNRICVKHGAASRTVAHAGDGNIHLMILKAGNTLEEWPEKLAAIQQEIFDYVYDIGGKLSGEHGIGYKKKTLMAKYTDPVELEIMRAIKKALDPNNILNPGKIFDLD